jgi:hypothetical protein
VFLLVACNQYFDLQPTAAAPPADAIDAVLESDGDGVIDLDDNCRSVPNPNQHDEDRDGVGDECDNCPLVENNAQRDDGDSDGVGDACDPHPLASGDCLVLFDSFADPTAFDAHWLAQRPPNLPTLDVQVDHFRVTPVINNAGAVVSRDLMMAGPYSVQLTANLAFATQGASFGIATGLGQSPLVSGLQCVLGPPSIAGKPPTLTASQDGAGQVTSMSGPPVDPHLLFRLAVPTPPSATLTCRVSYGFEIGFQMVAISAFTPGNVGFVVHQDSVDVEAIAIYNVQTSTCTPPTVR